MSLRIKRRTNGSYDLGENVRVSGKKTPRFKAILHLGKNPTIDAAIEARRRDRCDPRRRGETQIDAESRRAKAKLIIEQLKTMKMRAQHEAETLALKLVTKTVVQKMEREPCKLLLAETARKHKHHAVSQCAPETLDAHRQMEIYKSQFAPGDQAAWAEGVLRHKRILMKALNRVKLLRDRPGSRRSWRVRCDAALSEIERRMREFFPNLGEDRYS